MQPALRLRHRKDFVRLRQEGQTKQHKLLRLSFAPSALAHNRYGFIVSGRIGKAVVRNRLRRRLKEIVRELHPQIMLPDANSKQTSMEPVRYGNIDCVFIARTHLAADASYNELREAVVFLLQRAQLLDHDH